MNAFYCLCMSPALDALVSLPSAPKVDVVDTTASGDTLLAEWCFSHDPKLAVSAGSAACTMPGSQAPSFATVERLVGILTSRSASM